MTIFVTLVWLLLSTATLSIECSQSEAVKISQDDQQAQTQYHYQGKSYQNKFDLPLHFECNARNGEALNQVRSVYHNRYGDRLWSWGCKKASSVPLTDCSWSGLINHWQGPIRFMCPKGKVMTGVDSKHWNQKEDRRWKIKCCAAKDYHTEECQLTKHLNDWKAYFEHKAAPTTGQRKCSKNKHRDETDGEVFVGMVSNWKGYDRKWQMIECEFEKDQDSNEDKSRDKHHRHNCHKHRHGDEHSRSHSHQRCDSERSGEKNTRDSKSHDRSHDHSRHHRNRTRDRSRSRSHRSRDRTDHTVHSRSHRSRDRTDHTDHSRSSQACGHHG